MMVQMGGGMGKQPNRVSKNEMYSPLSVVFVCYREVTDLFTTLGV